MSANRYTFWGAEWSYLSTFVVKGTDFEYINKIIGRFIVIIFYLSVRYDGDFCRQFQQLQRYVGKGKKLPRYR